MNRQIEFTVEQEDNGSRLDAVLAREVPDFSRASLQKLIKDGAVSVNGNVVILPRFALKANSVITLALPDESEAEIAAEDFDILPSYCPPLTFFFADFPPRCT